MVKKKRKAKISKWEKATVDERARMLSEILPNRKMDQKKLKQLLEIAAPEDQVKLKVLHNAVINCIRDYKDESTSAKLKDWRSAESALDGFINDLWEEHFNEGGATLPNILAVVTHLKSQGWKIEKSAAYKHRKEGKIRPQKNGAFRIVDVEKYAFANLKRLDGAKADPLDAVRGEKARAEADIVVYEARIKKIKAEASEGKYISREIFEEELAVQAQAFRNAIQTYVHSQAEEITNLISGDVSKIPDLIRLMVDRADEHFFRYADEWQTKGPLIVAISKTRSKEETEEDDVGADETEEA